MKKSILIITLFFSCMYGFSQEKDVLYGVRAGLNISNLDFDPAPEFTNDHRNGFAFGFFGEFELSDAISLMPELQFSAEGAKEKSIRLDYIQAPILFKYRISDKLFAGAGPLVGVKIHEENDGFKNFALSGIIGGEYMITSEIFVDVRYSYGFTNKIDKESDYTVKQTNIQFGIGYKI
ncbi:porin family protein [Lacinutrix sp. C3R15]|uniref:porin family protein n=1 Tax=Flavobacteriaceae TaxID=49546 RepID=UPI001C08B57C|nr:MULTISPECIES: porin family protein [Flavobacteriaceae]MBU2940104.1 porin family protein [Lacinutrix sp. C3R15]MDO6623421.1 porin family protein [Oceanihabitans sp. 1_MG-2023]